MSMIKNVDKSGAEIDLAKVIVTAPTVKELIKSINRKEQNESKD